MKTGHRDERLLNTENYVSFIADGKDYLFKIIKTEETNDSIVCYSETMGLELLNEISPAYSSSTAQTFAQYFNTLIGGYSLSGIVIGTNDVASYSRTLSWEGSDNKLARLLSLANKFDAEIELITVLNPDGTFKQITLNVYGEHSSAVHGVGIDRKGLILNYGRDIQSIRRTVDITGLCSAIRPVGRDDLSIASHGSYTEYDSENRPLYVFTSGQNTIYAPQAAEKYPSNLVPNAEKYAVDVWDYDTDSVNTLSGRRWAG